MGVGWDRQEGMGTGGHGGSCAQSSCAGWIVRAWDFTEEGGGGDLSDSTCSEERAYPKQRKARRVACQAPRP
jgi:hypothetical protein